MLPMKPGAAAAVIGDIVGSRLTADRVGLHQHLIRSLDAVASPPTDTLERLAVTVGDEFQGRFATVGAALEVTHALRIDLLPEVDVRFGIGWGVVMLLDPDRGTQDGPGWWAARAAIDEVRRTAQSAATRDARTAYHLAADEMGPPEAALAAALLCRDHMVGSLDDRSLEVVRGLMAGHTQAQVAELLGISASAVSQRVRSAGLGVLLEASRRLEEVQ